VAWNSTEATADGCDPLWTHRTEVDQAASAVGAPRTRSEARDQSGRSPRPPTRLSQEDRSRSRSTG
jgi:hypothetical protein